jgi:AraC-like DNA-binding protein
MHTTMFVPRARLRPFVECYTLVECDRPASHDLLPGIAPTLALRWSGEVHSDEGGKPTPFPLATVSGMRSSPRSIRYGGGGANLVVRFREGAARVLLGVPLHHVGNAMVPLGDLVGREADFLHEQIAEIEGTRERIEIVESFLESRVPEVVAPSRIDSALVLIHLARGDVRIRDLARRVGSSLDSFEKQFRADVGISPKRFAGLVRMHHAVDLGRAGVGLGDLPHRCGHFDQSHFIREFKRFAGRVPSEFFAEAPAW